MLLSAAVWLSHWHCRLASGQHFKADLARCQLLVPVIICALCLSDGHMHVMNRQLFSIKIIPSSSGLLSAKLHLCPTELHASRQLTE